MEKIEETALKDINDIYLTFFFLKKMKGLFLKKKTPKKNLLKLRKN